MNSKPFLKTKPIEIFCGTGGVGKTTLAASRALYLSSLGQRILLITIDPAKRLKEILSLTDEDAGQVHQIPLSIFKDFKQKNHTFDALLMSPSATMKRITGMVNSSNGNVADENIIIKNLMRPHAGMYEIMSVIEVHHHLDSKKYDSIILDTPPGKHFVDFLQASKKIQQFFERGHLDFFKYLGKSNRKSEKFLPNLVSSTTKKLLGYLSSVTGVSFVQEFIECITTLYHNKDSFLKALSFQANLQKIKFSNWFLVTSVEQGKLSQTKGLQNTVCELMHEDNYLVINKSLMAHLDEWDTTEVDNVAHQKLKDSLWSREKFIKDFSTQNFQNTLIFPEILKSTPEEHVNELAKNWN